MTSSFQDAIDRFTTDAESLKETLPAVMTIVGATRIVADKEFRDFVTARGVKKTKEKDKSTSYTIPPDAYEEFRRLNRRWRRAHGAGTIVPRSFLVSLVSVFDAYLGRLIRSMFDAQPGLLNTSDKQVDFAQLLAFDSIEEARVFFMEKEVEAVLRESHADQWRWLEAKLKIPLRENLDVWPIFIEVTERRNLFVHSDGVVSSQYLKVCQDHKVSDLENVKAGEILMVSPDYFANASDAVLEIGIKLGHVIWRKLLPADRAAADNALTAVTFQFLVESEYALAIRLLEFATNVLKTYSSEEARLKFVVNLAQAYKWTARQKDCEDLLGRVDWSAKAATFRLARDVLLDRYAEAAKTMKKIGVDGELQKSVYRDWPLFKEWRKTAEFLDAYRKVFGQDFSLADTELRQEKDSEGASSSEAGPASAEMPPTEPQ